MTRLLLTPVLSAVGMGVTLGMGAVLVAAWSKALEEWIECLRR